MCGVADEGLQAETRRCDRLRGLFPSDLALFWAKNIGILQPMLCSPFHGTCEEAAKTSRRTLESPNYQGGLRGYCYIANNASLAKFESLGFFSPRFAMRRSETRFGRVERTLGERSKSGFFPSPASHAPSRLRVPTSRWSQICATMLAPSARRSVHFCPVRHRQTARRKSFLRVNGPSSKGWVLTHQVRPRKLE